MKKAKYNPKLGTWTCGCGSGLPALYNVKNKPNCLDDERGCAWCFKKYKRAVSIACHKPSRRTS